METKIFPPWHGELGWEIMSWVPFCRKRAEGCDQVIASSFAGMQPLYADFVTEFRPHRGKSRSLNYPKVYRPDGKYYIYGHIPIKREDRFDILIHARGTRRKSSINYHQWYQVAACLRSWKVAFIGSVEDQIVEGFPDLRGIDLQRLIDLMAGAKLTVGVSSGVMHLAAACGCNLVVWGDRRTYFGETLEQRYKVTWNPFDVKVGWINADNWQPQVTEIIRTIDENLAPQYSALVG